MLLVVAGLLALVRVVAGPARSTSRTPHKLDSRFATTSATARIDSWLHDRWKDEGLTPAAAATDLAILRRLSLALHGTVPSLEELRDFQSDTRPQRIERWTQRLLSDSRYATYVAERLGRVLVGVDEGPFLAFRSDRFHAWLADELAADRPWDRIVVSLVAARGLPTDRPATNFITVAQIDDDVDEEQLAGRSIRAFLGQRIDCAQCHDHFFDPRWKQAHFQGLAAFYAPARFTALGVDDDRDRIFEITDHETKTTREIDPGVPFGAEWLPENGSNRRRLAAWLTDPRNKRFDRAIVNRAWGLMFGRPFYAPVDDLPDPGDPATRLLDLLAEDFRDNGRRLKWLFQALAASQPFRLDSRLPTDMDGGTVEVTREDLERHELAWAVFPLVRLRPEQVIGAMLQAASVKTIDRHSHLATRARRFFGEQDFVQEYGDLGDEELVEQAGTIPQALLRMNGRLANELISAASGFTAPGAIADASDGDDRLCLATCFEVCVGRMPEAEESAVFLEWLKGTSGQKRYRAVEDIFWSLFNSPEFSWNH